MQDAIFEDDFCGEMFINGRNSGEFSPGSRSCTWLCDNLVKAERGRNLEILGEQSWMTRSTKSPFSRFRLLTS